MLVYTGRRGFYAPSKPLIGGERMESSLFRGYIDFMAQIVDDFEKATMEYYTILLQELL